MHLPRPRGAAYLAARWVKHAMNEGHKIKGVDRNGLPALRRRIAQLQSKQPKTWHTGEAFLLSHYFLEVANRHTRMLPLLNEFVRDIREVTGCKAVGVRIRDADGNIPYTYYEGFTKEFYEKESPLSVKSDKCMCINVVKGATDPSLPFYTEYGSFYMNGTTLFLSTVSDEEKGQTRNECNRVGYESVALIPIRAEGGILGLVHIADPEENMLPMELVTVLEDVAMHLGAALWRVWAQEEREKLILDLQEALGKIRTLRGLIPICASCKKIRDDDGYWHQVEAYVGDHSEAEFSHGICPECAEKLYSDVFGKGGGNPPNPEMDSDQ